ncbi:WecB/TagA/CpsF family glycosyltransferase [Bacillus inaquosorum]|uniref:WecB/TagA/CpsF family glycosyltransferase n=1 Tax=Bacillus inaquosorum TaxID=483913 RepID=UPI002282C8C8|nr:WecB/TagA/CpsF family glycosyltransferase [Bacillus inaquosorum]MCY9010356.1 WecB/TagA/CpsF family glycosyltransferase [Bacillus inaquosorum]MCY9037886.1 WecB/TagA/CpsF family glycosyltransferase [Bacillus inaquosorum]MCY9044838.1 WecB/TagA/CpsF family glycosyltransferase [Bacillus inaquosorum]
MQTKSINQLDFVDSELTSFVSHLETSYLDQNKGAFIVTANPEIGFEAMQNPRYEAVLSSADFILPDGIGVVLVSKMIGKPLQSRIAGYDLFTSLLEKADQKKKRVFFYGAAKHVIAETIERVKRNFPGIEIAGYSDGYVKDQREVADKIAASNPDMVFVALGYPNQEFFIHKYRHLFPQAVAVGLGGSFDVFSGNVKRAPSFFIRFHLEWMYRLITNPSRWRRMLSIPKYVTAVLKHERASAKPQYTGQVKDQSRHL